MNPSRIHSRPCTADLNQIITIIKVLSTLTASFLSQHHIRFSSSHPLTFLATRQYDTNHLSTISHLEIHPISLKSTDMAPSLSNSTITNWDFNNATSFTLNEWSQTPGGILVYLVGGIGGLFILFCIVAMVSKRAYAFESKMATKASQFIGKLFRKGRAPPSDHAAGEIELSDLGQGNGGGDVNVVEGAGHRVGATVVGGGGDRGGQFGREEAGEEDVSVGQVEGDYHRQGLVG